MRKLIPLVALLPLALAACSGSDKPRTQPTANVTPFSQALASEYKLLSDSEFAEGDWADKAAFAKKSQLAASGTVPAPEDPTKRNVGTGFHMNTGYDIGKEQRNDAIRGRETLLAALNSDAPSRNPNAMARAQASYDCWVEQLEEGWQRDDIERCRKAFEVALAEATAKPQARGPMKNMQERFQIFFEFDKATLDAEDRRVIAEAAQDIIRLRTPAVAVAGYTDKAGDPSYNQKLSEQRGRVVAEELIKNGVPREVIHVRGFGEREPAIQTPDGQRNAQNRRSIIEFD